jgi:hypothetical protein
MLVFKYFHFFLWLRFRSEFRNATSANYTIDDQDPINFLLPLYPNGAGVVGIPNQKLFDTEQLPLGQHMVVVGNVTTEKVPLCFNYFLQGWSIFHVFEHSFFCYGFKHSYFYHWQRSIG